MVKKIFPILLFVAAATGGAVAFAAPALTAKEKEKLWVLTGLADERGERRAAARLAALTPERCEKYAIREVVLLWDADYDFNWVTAPEKVRDFFSARGVPALTVAEATAWLDAKTAGVADGTAVIMGNGITPKAWLAKPWAESRIVRYLKAGGRIVWAGDVMFCRAQDEDGGLAEGGGTFARDAFRLGGCLGMRVERAYQYGNYTNGTVRTAKAKAWGLEQTYGLVRPVLNDGVLDPFAVAADGSLADHGQVCLKPENPLSGIVILTGPLNGERDAALRDVWRCAWWSGKPLAVPASSGAALAAARPPELIFGSRERRTVFLRGEQVTVSVRLNGAKGGKAALTLADAQGAPLRSWRGEIAADGAFAVLDLRGLRRDAYTAELTLDGRTVVRRELRVAPSVDKQGLSVSMWTEFSKSPKRLRRQMEREILAYGLEPLPVGEGANEDAADWALWYGVPFVARRMPDTTKAWTPEGYDNWIRLPDGSIRPVLAEGNRPVARGYDSPVRRQLQADRFREMGMIDAAYPAYRGVTFTADDYSQWFGKSWNRFAVEGFRNRYGVDLPRELAVAEGIVPDDDPSVLAAHWFAETHADAAKRSSEALKEATGGKGLAAPIPGAMQIPMNMYSMMYPGIGFGANGWSQASFYYYNGYWQPFTANAFWTAAARMGDRRRTVWAMPDCYLQVFESYYEQNLWNFLAGGVQGLGYFRLAERKEASKRILSLAGRVARRYGAYLNTLEPARAKAVQVIPFENMIAAPDRWHQSAIIWSNLELSGVDVDPVTATEDWETARAALLFNVRTLAESGLENVRRFAARGGTVYIDEASAKAIPHAGMVVVPAALARIGNGDFDSDAVRSAALALAPEALRPYSSSSRGVYARRFADRLGNRVCWFVDTVCGEVWQRFHRTTRRNQAGDATLEAKGGYGTSFTTEITVREEVSPVIWDVFAKRAIDWRGRRFAITLPRWGAKIVAFLPESPAPFEVEAPGAVRPGVPFAVAVVTSGKCAVPFTVSAVDPSGAVSAEYRGRLVSGAEGRAGLPFAFAVNDRRGGWTFRVTNEFTGETKSVSCVLREK